jgi:hypothetical protein
MVYDLHPLFQSLSTAPTEQALRSRFRDGVSASFGVQRWGIYLLIGAELWITQNSVKQALKRMFRKLEVSARTEMVAKLRD